MGRVRQYVGRLVHVGAAFERIDRLQAELDELRAHVRRLDDETGGLRAEVHGSVTDLTERIGSLSDRVERSGA